MKIYPVITDVAAPVVGRYYMVPCVRTERSGHNPGGWVPIIGNWHQDAEIGTDYYHYHTDVRFLSPKRFAFYRDYHASHEAPAGYSLRRINPRVENGSYSREPGETYFRRLKMHREMPSFPAYFKDTEPTKIPLVATMEGLFKEVKMDPRCMKCPHRGLDLRHGAVQADGSVICNGHGLRWNTSTGELIIR